jgi:uncharacterized delta-60 repeat protein
MPFLSTPKTRLTGFRFAGLVLMASLGSISGEMAASTANDGFDPNANGNVYTISLQPDGKILMGGSFTQLQPFGNVVSSHAYIARLNHDGTVDSSFSPQAGDVVNTMTLQPNGQILVGGRFMSMRGTGSTSPVTRNFAARLNSDGTLDTVFNPNPNGVVYAMIYQPNGQIVIGGSFTTVQPNGASSPITRNHVARFNTDGSLDMGFNPNTDKTVLALGLQTNGQIVVGGGFATLQPNGSTTPTTRSCAARINSDGSLDATWDPEPNGSVEAVLVLPSQEVVLGGEFVTVQPDASTGAIQCDFLARLNPDGSLEGNFIINPLESVTALAVQPDGKLVVGGNFTQVFPENNLSSVASPYVTRINDDGSVDTTFIPGPNQAVSAIAVQPDGDVLLGGYFTTVQPLDTSSPSLRNHIARVDTYGVPDSTVDPDSSGQVFASAVLPSGQILVGGTFLSIGGVTQNFLARLNASGSLDTTFTPTVNGPIQAIVLQSNGQILISGSFSAVDGIGLGNVARLNANGTVDGSFNPNVNSNVDAMALASNGQIYIGGNFTLIAPNGSTTGYAISSLARLNPDGSLDLTFNPAPNGSVFCIVIDSNGKILIGGGFTSVGVAQRGYIARLLSTGALDTSSFDPEANAPVYAIALGSNGQIVIGGSFTALIPQTAKAAPATTSTATNNPYGAQTVLPAPGTSAITPIYVNHLARLNTDGTLDTTFYPDPSSDVLGIAIQSNGAMVVGGIFTSFAPNNAVTGTLRNYIGRVNADGSIDANFNPSLNQLVNTVTVLPNQHILVGGAFTSLQASGGGPPTFFNHVAILDPDGSIDPTFSFGAATAPTGQVRAFAQQPNGQVIFAGSFSPMDGSNAAYISRLNGDATIDPTFNSGADGPVNSVAVLPSGASTVIPTNSGVWLNPGGSVRYTYSAATNGEIICSAQQADGKLIIGGLFSTFAGVAGLQNIVRLNTDGSVDTSFEPSVTGAVSAIVIQPADGKIVIGGGFTSVSGVNNAYLARLNTDGSVDSAFSPTPNLQVLSLLMLPNGQILVGGDFSQMLPNEATTVVSINFLARVNADGTVDSAFNPDINGPVYCLGINASGQYILGGSFTSFTPNLGSTTYNLENLARVNPNGTPDTAFYPDPNAAVVVLAVLANGQVIAGGSFTAWEQNANLTGVTPPAVTPGTIVSSNYLSRINTDGTVDTTFAPNPNGPLSALTLQPDGKMLLGGSFSALQPNRTGIPADRSDIARINADGTIDLSFDPSLNGVADTIAYLSDGSLFVGGNFTTIQVGGAALIGGSFANVGGLPAPNLARLNADGSYDSSFTSNADGTVNAITVLPGGAALVGGTFAHVQGNAQANLARLTAGGSFDPTFAPAVNGPVNAVAVQTNGEYLVGGSFTTAGGVGSPNLARLGPSGSPDATFLPSVNGTVDAVVAQANGQIVVAGSFTSVGGHPIVGVARLNSNGSVDTSFNPAPNGTVNAVTLQVDGTYYVAGTFTTIGGQAIPYAAHLTATGAVDTSFTAFTNGPVDALMVEADGKVFLGGGFTAAGSLSRFEIARFEPSAPVTQSVSVSSDQSTITWTRGGGAPAFASVGFEETTDGTHWTSVGQATTADGVTWQLTGVPSSGSSLVQVRATGVSPSSAFSSSGLIQVIYLANSSIVPVVSSPSAVTGTAGSPLSFTVTASQSPTSFSASGLPPGLTINPATGVISGTPTGSGTYNVTLTVGNGSGSAVSALTITLGSSSTGSFVPAATSSTNRLINLSSRADLTGTQTLIAGFVISGTGSKPVLLRAVGPGLQAFSVPGFMATPELQLYSSSGTLISQNSTWGGGSALTAVFAQVGAFSLPSTSLDAAILTTLAPGSYTIHVFDPSGHGGIVLTEVYDASPTPATAAQRLINISARGTVSPGAGALIGGFVISGTSVKSVLIRGIGPGLAAFAVTDAISDPVLSVFDSNGNLVAQNFRWSNQTITGAYQDTVVAQDITNADTSVGAFALSTLNADTALLADLPPGAYTFQVTSASNATGEALGEVYELP